MDAWSNFLQAWNHDFFWSSIYPGGGGQPDGEVLELIERDFGLFEEFAKEFKAAVFSLAVFILSGYSQEEPVMLSRRWVLD